MEIDKSKLYTEPESSDILRLRPNNLRKRRMKKLPPTYLKLGGAIRYRGSDLIAFIEQNVRQPEKGE
jgi:hypothetical protein